MIKTYELEDFLSLKKNLSPMTKVRILSGSMEPFISKNEFIYISPEKNIDDIPPMTPIVFWQDRKLICHLFIKKEIIQDDIILHTRGLSSKVSDQPFNSFYFLGIVSEPKMSAFRRLLLKLFF